ncbi:MAG TPA: hypothetical protein PLP88_01515 [Bacteroidales bacterium]|nr:hypothetical protein [Bacteroidales bacterium]
MAGFTQKDLNGGVLSRRLRTAGNIMVLLTTTLLIILFITGCKTNKIRITNCPINKIEVTYLKGYFETTSSFDCDSFPNAIHMSKERFVDTVIIDKTLLCKISNELTKLAPDDTLVSPDVRLKCKVYKLDNTVDLICLGDWFGTAFNGQPCNDNYNLVFLIKFNSGYYNYFNEAEFLKYFLELKDSLKYNQAFEQLEIFQSKRIRQTWSDTTMVKIGL